MKTLQTLRRAVLLISLPFGILHFILPIYGQEIGADAAGEDARGHAFGGVDQASNQGAILGNFIGFVILVGGFEIRLSGHRFTVGSAGIAERWVLLFSVYGVVCLVAALLAWRRLPETNPTGSGDRRSPSPIVWSRPWVLLLAVTAVTGASWAMLGVPARMVPAP